MTRGSFWRRRVQYAILLLCLLIAVAVLAFGSALLRFDYTHLFDRAAWQITDRVMENLPIRPGNYVADIGAGDGYFTFRLADAVGPDGRVFAVDVDEAVIRGLEQQVRERSISNVEVVLGEFDDPLLPDNSLDLAFLCNSYHHIENRVAYFERLKMDLRASGRIAVLDLRGIPLVKLLAPAGHWSAVVSIRQEMADAGYREDRSFDFLPIQSFLIFGFSH
jgi:ubiquinone/menaquinone biosynthesis C-methylase UbiE